MKRWCGIGNGNRSGSRIGIGIGGAAALILVGCSQEPPAEAPEAPATSEIAFDAADPPPTGPLSDDAVPTRYELKLRIDPRAPRFSGEVVILVEIARPVSRLWLHGQGLNVTQAYVERDLTAAELLDVIDANELSSLEQAAADSDLIVDGPAAGGDDASADTDADADAPAAGAPDGPEVIVQSSDQTQRIEAAYEQALPAGVARLSFAEPLPAGPARLVLRYDAAFGDRAAGLYVAEEGGQPYVLANLKPNYARRVFPAFDEPRFRAPFAVRLEVLDDDFAIANGMGVAREPIDETWDEIVFLDTPPLPTYQISFAVGPYQFARWTNIPSNEIRPAPLPLGAAFPIGKAPQSVYALQQTAPVVAALEAYFGRPYPLDKLDLIAAPRLAGGMLGNAGAAIYAENRILINAEAPLTLRRDFVALHAQNLAHHWLDSAAAPDWWTQGWLNDALALQLGGKIAARINAAAGLSPPPKANIRAALRRDELASAMVLGRSTIADFNPGRAFDPFPAQKGAGVLSMVESLAGAETYQGAVRQYLDPGRGASGSVGDFTRQLGRDAAGPAIEGVLAAFLDQPGAPNIDAAVNCGRSNRPRLRLRQSAYRPIGSAAPARNDWNTPVCLRYEAGGESRQTCALLTERDAVIDLEGGACPTYLTPNAGGAGYYRWTLDRAGWDALRENLDALSPAEAASYADALGAAVRSGAMTFTDYLDHAAAISQSANFAASEILFADVTEWIEIALRDKGAARDALRARMRGLFAPKLAGLAESGAEAAEIVSFHGAIAEFMSLAVEDPGLRSQLQAAAAAYVGLNGAADASVMDSELRSAAFRVGAQTLGAAFADRLFEIIETTNIPSLRADAIRGLGATTAPALVASVLQRSLDGALDGDALYDVLGQMLRGAGRDAAWNFFTQNADAILDRLSEPRAAAAPRLGAAFCTARSRDLFRTQFQPRVDAAPVMSQALAETLEGIDLCAALAEELGPAVAAALVE